MFDASLCAGMVVKPPQVSPAGLEELWAILDSRSGGSTGSWKCLQKEARSMSQLVKWVRVRMQLPLELVSVYCRTRSNTSAAKRSKYWRIFFSKPWGGRREPNGPVRGGQR